jgi:hypothetical protein
LEILGPFLFGKGKDTCVLEDCQVFCGERPAAILIEVTKAYHPELKL